MVGGQLRATSTLFYPTITSMYLEVVFALGLGMDRHRSRLWRLSPLALAGAGIIATFTRAGLDHDGDQPAVLRRRAVCVQPPAQRPRRWSRGTRALAALAALLVALVLLSRSPQLLLTRMSTEGSQDWYGAIYTVPASG